ncbi:hypothetical protein Tco_0091880 [Tanacetum coccineum]
MDRLSKRKFGIVCHGKVVRIPLEGDEILQVHGERTQGVMKTLMNTKAKCYSVKAVKDNGRNNYDTIRDMIILRIGSKYEYEIRYHPGKENVVIEALSRKERVKPIRVRAMAMTIQYGKCLADASLHVPLGEIKVDKTLRFVEEPVEIMDHEVKSLKRSKIALCIGELEF